MSLIASKLRHRSDIIDSIRRFFKARGVLEVDTPILSPYGVTDVFIDSITANALSRTHYLQTSPEYAMKRLLAAGSGDIYQLCKAFRNDEVGRLHRPEFLMLEWYRLGWNHHQLMDEMDELLSHVINSTPATRISYQALFEEHLHFDPHTVDIKTIKTTAHKHQLLDALGDTHNNIDDWLMLLLSHVIEPKLGFDAPCFIYDYPKTQAALAQVNNNVAERFEVYINGIELANGFHELRNPEEQLKRFEADNTKRKQLGKPAIPIDTDFIKALEQGLPDCSGVALGVDRLIMIALNQPSLDQIDYLQASN